MENDKNLNLNPQGSYDKFQKINKLGCKFNNGYTSTFQNTQERKCS